MNMHFREFENILLVIAFVRGFITNRRIEHRRPQQDESKEYSTNISHRLPFYALTDRMLKRATILSHPPQRAKTRMTPKGRRLSLRTSKILHQITNRVIQQGRRKPAD